MNLEFITVLWVSCSAVVGIWLLLCAIVDGIPEGLEKYGQEIHILYYVMVFAIGFVFWPYIVCRVVFTEEKKDGR
ncbi:MAG: hypothetical protein GTO00_09240 [Deltaproteobacteria bacterium]|nr:hypothetical protein [Deltaproteobacteria bacterium]